MNGLIVCFLLSMVITCNVMGISEARLRSTQKVTEKTEALNLKIAELNAREASLIKQVNDLQDQKTQLTKDLEALNTKLKEEKPKPKKPRRRLDSCYSDLYSQGGCNEF